ncbi:MAG: hypothetical protein QM736_20030 [Vicinamibacterales bacterium]
MVDREVDVGEVLGPRAQVEPRRAEPRQDDGGCPDEDEGNRAIGDQCLGGDAARRPHGPDQGEHGDDGGGDELETGRLVERADQQRKGIQRRDSVAERGRKVDDEDDARQNGG